MKEAARHACPSDEILVLHLDGELGSEIGTTVRAHLVACPPCAERLARLGSLDDLVAGPEAPLPDRLLERLEAIPRRPHVPLLLPLAAAGLATAALLLLVLRLPREAPRQVPPVQDDAPRIARAVVGDRAAAIGAVLMAPTPAGTRWLAALGDGALAVLHRLARAADPRMARAALDRIGEVGSRTSLPTLLAVVESADRREAAVAALARLGDARAIPALDALLDVPEAAPAALAAMEAIGGAAAVQVVARRLATASDAAAVGPLLAVLGRMNGPLATDALLQLLAASDDPAPVRALFRDEPARWIPHLLTRARGRDEAVAQVALDVLADLAPAEVTRDLRPLLVHPTRRQATMRVLARVDSRAAAEAILEATSVGREAGRLLVPTPNLETLCLAWLAQDDRRRQARALDVLAQCGTERAVPALERAAGDPAVAPEVVRVLGRIPAPDAAIALGRLGRRSALSRDVLGALAYHAPADAIPQLLALGRAHGALREPAMRALGDIGTEDAVEAIVRLDGHPRTQRVLRSTLRDMERDVVVPTLVALLEGDLASEARRALRAVGGAPPARPRPTTWIQ